MKKHIVCSLIIGAAVIAAAGTAHVLAEETTQNSGAVHITFAENYNLDISYFSDEACSIPLSTENCRLNQGDKIYASLPAVKNAKSNLYRFDCFRIWSHNEDGSKNELIAKSDDAGGLVWTVPEDFTGTEISVEPLGGFEQRKLKFSTYSLDENLKEVELQGKWLVNGKSNAEVSPVESYKVVFDYSDYSDFHYFVSSTPKCFKNNESDCRVVFPEADSLNPVDTYTVQMHPYFSLRIIDPEYNVMNFIPIFERDAVKSVKKNGEEVSYSAGGNEKIDKLKAGDKIVVVVNSLYRLIGKGVNVGQPVEADGGYEYTFTIPDSYGDALEITLSKRSQEKGEKVSVPEIKNASITLYNKNGVELRPDEVAPDGGEMIKVVINPFSGYYVSGNDIGGKSYEKEMSFSDYKNNIDKIISEHTVKKYLAITLNNNNDYGTCAYFIDGQEVSGTQSVKEHQIIELKFTLAPDSDFKIKREGWEAMWSAFSPDSFTTKIEVTEDMNRTEIDCSRYFDVERKESK